MSGSILLVLFDKIPDYTRREDETGEGLAADPDRGHGCDASLAGPGEVGGDLDGFELETRGIGNDLFQDAAYIQAARAEDGAVEFYLHGFGRLFVAVSVR